MRQLINRRHLSRGLVIAGMAMVLAQPALIGAETPKGEAIPASECTVEPRSSDFLATLVQTPVPEPPKASPTAVPDGTPADEQTTKEITTAVREYIGCVNGGEYLRAFALYDDTFLRRVIDPTGELRPEVALEIGDSFATPTPLEPKELVYLVAIREIRQFSDGRVGAVVETVSESTSDKPAVDLFIYQNRDDRWLIVDAVQGFEDDSQI